MGLDECLMYCVEWNTRKARPARKSLDDNNPATGRRVKPVQSGKKVIPMVSATFKFLTKVFLKIVNNLILPIFVI